MAEAGIARHSRIWWLVPGFALFSLLRVPSFFEPHWYSDEASYAGVAKALLRGQVLYAQIWNNKPPLQSWTIAAVIKVFGPSEAGLHLLTFITGFVTLAAVAYAGWRILGPQRAGAATLLAGIALGLPVFDAEIALPESLLIAPVAWAGALTLVHIDPRRNLTRTSGLAVWPFLVGALVAAGIAYQQTVVAECVAFGLALALSPLTRRRDLLLYAATVAVITGVWVGIAIADAGAGRVGFALAGFYISYTQSVLPSSASGVIRHLVEVGVAGILLCAGAFLCRRMRTPVWAVALWAGASLLVAALARQPYAHFLTAAVAPVALLLAAIPAPSQIRAVVRSPVAVRMAPQLVAVLIAGIMASVAGLDWIPPAAPSPALNSYRTLTQYYGGAVHAAIKQNDADWDDSFDGRVASDAAIASWVAKERLAGASAVVWSSDAWVYSLADLPVLMPTPPIYNDEVLLGQNGPVATAVAKLSPTLIIVSADAVKQFPEIRGLLDGRTYQLEFVSAPGSVWVRSDAVASLP